MESWMFFNSINIDKEKIDFTKFNWQLELYLSQNSQLEKENWLVSNCVYRERHTANIAATDLIFCFPGELSLGRNVQ